MSEGMGNKEEGDPGGSAIVDEAGKIAREAYTR
jgi:hypothetical protein